MNKQLLSLLTSLLLTLAYTDAQALNCKNPQNGFEISQCLGQEERTVDKELNQVYSQLIKATNSKKQLIQSELAWIKWRDEEAKFQSFSYKGGTEEGREYSRWIIRLSRERILHLKEALEKLEH